MLKFLNIKTLDNKEKSRIFASNLNYCIMDYQINNVGIGYQLIVNGYPVKGLFPTFRLAEKRAKEIIGEFVEV